MKVYHQSWLRDR